MDAVASLSYLLCRICAKRIVYNGVGRHPMYCSRSCRELAAFGRAFWRGPVALGRGGRVVNVTR